jgi:glyoxylase-like metal-dependent hydrolase (beta-lactamase superfamily II)
MVYAIRVRQHMRHARFTIDADRTPRFTACYLRVAGDECAFIEAHTVHALPRLLASLEENARSVEDVRWIIVTHAHLDHAAGAGALLAACPNAMLVANARTVKHLVAPEKLVTGARAVYGDAFDALFGEVRPVPEQRARVVEDGGSVDLGDAKLTFFATYGHAFHHSIVDDPAMDTVFTGDTFGLVYPALQESGRFALPSTSPTGFHAEEARRSIDRVISLGRRTVCPTHYDGWTEVPQIGAQVRRFVDRAGQWVDAASRTADPVGALEVRFASEWWKAIEEEAPRFGTKEKKLLELDVRINSQGLAHAADSMRRGRAPT